jgi:4-hydroxybenzoate polyprenyltransferase
VRPANVVTALADVLAGCAVAGQIGGRSLPWLLASSACLYAGGVALNDVFDRKIDRTERPERPIPSGRVSVRAAAGIGGGLLIAGAGLAAVATRAAGIVALLLAGCVLLYDAWGKLHPVLGPINMASCRALNLVLGLATIPAAIGQNWPVALLPLGYIYAVTAVSRGEVHGGPRRVAAIALSVMVLVVTALAVIAMRAAPMSLAGVLLSLALGAIVLPAFWRAWSSPAPFVIRRAVRAGVLSLVLLDAVLGAVYAGTIVSAAILAIGAAAFALARLFSVT